MAASVSASSPLPPSITTASQASSTQALVTHTIVLFNPDHSGTHSPAAKTSAITNIQVSSANFVPNNQNPATNVGAWSPNFSKPVFGALIGAVIAIVLFISICLVRKRLVKRRRLRQASHRSRAQVLQMQMDEATMATNRAVFGEAQGERTVRSMV